VPEIVLAHDYLVQFGGAERVVAHWATGFDARTLVTLAYRAESTFEDFDRLDVRASLSSAFTGQVERMLPLLPAIAARTTVSSGDGDIALASSSGWAHRFTYEIPHVVYVHSPARWLYAADDYRMQLSLLRRAGLAVSTPLLRNGDLEAMRRADAIVANSVLTRDRIRSAYGLDSVVVSPPVERVSASQTPPAHVLPEQFAVVVARARGYKNVALAIASASEAGLPIAVVGAGSEAFDDPGSGVHGLGRLDDAELGWVYGHAAVVLGAGHEDFGLTVIEAALEGTPAATIAQGGYLETVSPGVSGYHAASATAADLATAIRNARDLDPSATREWARGFGRDAHVARLARVLDEVAQRA
jgi:glycosyltransferase involved in cell wall biosynthesis